MLSYLPIGPDCLTTWSVNSGQLKHVDMQARYNSCLHNIFLLAVLPYTVPTSAIILISHSYSVPPNYISQFPVANHLTFWWLQRTCLAMTYCIVGFQCLHRGIAPTAMPLSLGNSITIQVLPSPKSKMLLWAWLCYTLDKNEEVLAYKVHYGSFPSFPLWREQI